jgi:hypothetical protein
VFEGVLAGTGLALGRFGSGGFFGVLAVGLQLFLGNLLVTHGKVPFYE